MNHDGFDDLAVGAPAELSEGQGMVYIYLGSAKGVQHKHFQVKAPQGSSENFHRRQIYNLRI